MLVVSKPHRISSLPVLVFHLSVVFFSLPATYREMTVSACQLTFLHSSLIVPPPADAVLGVSCTPRLIFGFAGFLHRLGIWIVSLVSDARGQNLCWLCLNCSLHSPQPIIQVQFYNHYDTRTTADQDRVRNVSIFARIQVDSCKIKCVTDYLNGGEPTDSCKIPLQESK